MLEEPEALIGSVVDRYRLEEVIGMGGYGVVYRATHVHLGRTVALKLIRRLADAEHAVQRFVRESQATSSIHSPHVVQVFDCGVAEYPFLALEYLVGESLESWMGREGAGCLSDALLFTEQMLTGLEAAHGVGVVHRDLKPSNVFLREAAERVDVVLLDFGIAKVAAARSSLTRTGTMMGTPRYAAPEQLRSAKDADARSDLYAAGVILYRMLSGSYPFDTAGYERMLIAIARHARTPLKEVAPHIPKSLAAVADRAVAFDPSARFQSAQAMRDALVDAMRSPAWARVSSRAVPTMPVVDVTPFQGDTVED